MLSIFSPQSMLLGGPRTKLPSSIEARLFGCSNQSLGDSAFVSCKEHRDYRPRPDESIKYINAIAFDGGGVRGAASAKIMEIIEGDLSGETGTEEHIADYFDMFGGTSTGGLIAMMLGRLRVTAKALLPAYSKFSKCLFKSKFKLFRSFFMGRKYCGNRAEKHFEDIVSEYSSQPEGRDTKLYSKEPGAPDVFVTALDESNITGKPLVLRSYDIASDVSYEHRIVDAARATTAAPGYFPPKTLGNGKVAVDGGLKVNNPTDLLITEARERHGRGVRFRLLLSIGTGEREPVALPPFEVFSVVSFFRAITGILTDSENIHRRVEQRWDQNNMQTYIRINVPAIGSIKLDDYKAIPRIICETEEYMNTPKMKKVRKTIVATLLSSKQSSAA